VERWNESGRAWEKDHGLLDSEQVAQCERADVAEPLHSPVPTRMISNGGYLQVPQTDQQKRVEARVEALADAASQRVGIEQQFPVVDVAGAAAAMSLAVGLHERPAPFGGNPLELVVPLGGLSVDGVGLASWAAGACQLLLLRALRDRGVKREFPARKVGSIPNQASWTADLSIRASRLSHRL
jgi:hypothetical protein